MADGKKETNTNNNNKVLFCSHGNTFVHNQNDLFSVSEAVIMSRVMRKPSFLQNCIQQNQRSAVLPCRLISTFVVRCLDYK